MIALAIGVILGGLTIVAVSRSDTAIASGGSVLFSFDGMPGAPLPYTQGDFLSGWDVQIHDRDNQPSHPGTSESFNAEHGPDCSAPPAEHSTGTSEANHVFQCHDHMMTAIDSDNAGYGVIYLTPPDMVNFANGGTVSWDMSTEKDSKRDWWDITVSPFLESQATPLLSDLSQGVDLQNPNRDSVVVTTDNGEGAPNLKVVTNGSVHSYGGSGQGAGAGIAANVNQAMNRQHFKLTISPTHVRFERLASDTAPALVFIDKAIPALSWTQGVIQLGHHSYTPSKDGAGSPNTWHWDEVNISPAVPFTIGKVVEPWVNKTTTIHAVAPAPAGSYLRFESLCRPSVNGTPATKMVDGGHPDHASSYMVPIAAGSTQWAISLGNDGWYDGYAGCLAQGFSVWSPAAGVPVSTPTKAPTSTPTSAEKTPEAASPSPTRTTTPAPTSAIASPTPSPAPTTPATRPPSGTAWTLAATVSPRSVSRGSQITITTNVTAGVDSVGLVDVELYDSSGHRVVQQFCDQQAFAAEQPKPFGLVYTIPSNAPRGSWTVKVAVFSAGWSALVAYNGAAESFTVR